MLVPRLARPRSLTSVTSARPTCYSCIRPASHCICGLVQPFTAHSNFLILQHPHERRKYHSSTKIVLKSVQNCEVLHGISYDPHAVRRALQGQTAYLLYPDRDALDCRSVHLDRSTTVIVVDGTWDEAQKIVYRNPFLREYPRISFRTELRSNYRIRRQPKDYCLSTLESMAYLLKLNAASRGLAANFADYDGLLRAFEQMVERQLETWAATAA